MATDTGTSPDPHHPAQPSGLGFPVVGLGASAGGIRALRTFLEHMPATPGMAFVVVMHLSPKHESNLDGILQQVTAMPVRQVRQTVPIERDQVYVIPPGLDLHMRDGCLLVGEHRRERGRHVAIDVFFRTLADAHGTRAFAVVLSGSGADGSVGIARIKEQGGVTLAQLPEDAEYDSMPRSAIATGKTDITLPVAEMPQRIIDVARNAPKLPLPPVGKQGDELDDAGNQFDAILRDVLTVVRARTGQDFRRYKRATILRRIERRMQVNAIADFADYASFLHANATETTLLLGDLLIGVTNFFRDREAFDALERDIIPELIPDGAGTARQPQDNREIRAWSVGCCSGEEAYSLAMLLSAQAERVDSDVGLQVFATDIDEHALARARAGLYPDVIVADVAPHWLRQYFLREGTRYRIKKEVRERVLFATHNVLQDPPFSRLDLISCRNLLIYLNRDVQAEVLRVLHFALRPSGILFLGGSESADACPDLFDVVDKKHRIYRARKVAGTLHKPLRLPLDNGQRRTATPGGPRPEAGQASFAEIHQRVLEQYAPPSIVVDTDGNVVHMSESAGRYLRHVGGVPSHHLPTLVHPDLRLGLRTALFQALHSGQRIEARRVRLQHDQRWHDVDMVLRPFHSDAHQRNYVLVLFDERSDVATPDGDPPRRSSEAEVLVQLEAELQRSREQLQLTLEHSETSTEELKASNEELQAINEELRSATEELETSKEELQSINEELITVNAELKVKVEETGKINDDLQNLIASTDIATLFVDRGLRIKWFTPQAAELFNVLRSDAGRSLLDITHRLDYPQLADDAAQAFDSLRTIEREVNSSDGRWFLARQLPYRTAEDRIEGAVLTFVDISARRRAEDRLRVGEAHMQLVAQSVTNHAIITLDCAGTITSWSRGAELLFGYPQDEAIGARIDLIFTPEDVAAGHPAREMEQALTADRGQDERWHLRRDGTRVYCSGGVHPMITDRLHGFVKIVRDVSAEHRRDAEQQTLLENTQQAVQAQDRFFAMMSHELKHPLNLIQLNAELLTRAPQLRGDALAASAAQSIQQAVRGQARIIDDLLDLSRIRTGKLRLSLGPVDLCGCVKRLVATEAAAAGAAGVTLECATPDTALHVCADEVRLEQVVWNLLSNALKFTPAGGRVDLDVREEAGQARLDVIDTGRGIAAEHLARVFDLFEQGTAAQERRGTTGLGIGLALVREIAGALDGRVEAVSEGPGHGSRFTLWLPLTDAQPGPVSGREEGRLTGARVLVVDDSSETLTALRMLLEIEGAAVESCERGDAAIARWQTQPFDILISDIGMPEMDGLELLRALATLRGGTPPPALALTGYGRDDDVRRALDAGYLRHLCKPVAFEALIDAVLATLGAT